MVLGIAAQLRGAHLGTRCPSLCWQGSLGPSPQQPDLQGGHQNKGSSSCYQSRAELVWLWLETLEFCCITVPEKLLLVGKIQWDNKLVFICLPCVWWCEQSQQSSFLVAPSAIPPQKNPRGPAKQRIWCEKGDTTLQKTGESKKEIWYRAAAAVTCGGQLHQAWHSVLGSRMSLSGFMWKLVMLEERLHPLKC